MENTPGEKNINQAKKQFTIGQKELPASMEILIYGLVSAVFSLLWCYWFGSAIGITAGIIAIYKSNIAKKLMINNPNAFTQASINNKNAGKVLGIVGLCLGIIGAAIGLLYLLLWLTW